MLSAVTGSPDGQGGGVRSRGNLTLSGCVVSDNLAIGADAVAGSPPGIAAGGGVCQLGGTLELIGDTISSNLAIGGGITAAGSTAVTGGAAITSRTRTMGVGSDIMAARALAGPAGRGRASG